MALRLLPRETGERLLAGPMVKSPWCMIRSAVWRFIEVSMETGAWSWSVAIILVWLWINAAAGMFSGPICIMAMNTRPELTMPTEDRTTFITVATITAGYISIRTCLPIITLLPTMAGYITRGRRRFTTPGGGVAIPGMDTMALTSRLIVSIQAPR